MTDKTNHDALHAAPSGTEPATKDTTPDWDQLERDVLMRIRLLRGVWDQPKDQPELRKKLQHDLYIPALRYLAAFCEAVQVEDDK